MTASPATSGYVAIARRTLDLEDYIDVARRHVTWIFGPLLAGIVISIVVAFSLPNVYISSAEMQITPAQISENIVQTTINQQLNERIMQMEQEILSRTSLSNIIQDPRLDLYKAERANKPLEDVIEEMRTRDIKIRIDSLAGEGARRASAFSISYSYPDRLKAQQTVQALITKFEDSNLTTQSKQQSVVNTFVHDELTAAKARLEQLNEGLTKFRIENSGKLPEESNLNMAQLTALQQKASGLNDALNRLAQERVQLDTNLQTAQDRLQLFDMFDKEAAPAAPVAVAARQQNELLTSLNRNIDTTESQLAQLRLIYKSTYPDIRDAEARLQVMRNQREQLQKKLDDDQAKEQARLNEAAKQPQPPARKTTNLAAAQSVAAVQAVVKQTEALIKSKEMEGANLAKEYAATNKQIDAYQARLAATSGIEASYAEMVANQRAASEKYQILQTKQQLTEQNGELLQRKAGENLEVLDPPSLPVQPAAPKRWLIVGAGTALAFIVGLAMAGVQEAKDTSLKNLKDVRAYTNLPVLSSIPLLENTMVVRRKRRIAYLAWSAAVIVGMLAVSASLYYHYTSTV
jgi:succinoglycan biosynthesis transport protein ExoP